MSKLPTKKSIISNFGALSTSLAEDPVEDMGVTSAPPAQPVARVGAGVIGATQRTLTDIREERDRLRTLLDAGGELELDPALIEPSPYPDRLPDDNDLDFEALKKSISDEGQKVPIGVRRHPRDAHRYQVVYGHRRWRAARELGQSVKAIVVTLSDRELVIAQGIENSARQDLSWIEKALFAWRMDEAGIKARDIRAALAIDDPELARFRAVCRALTVETIAAIGRAPKAGRPRWIALANAVTSEPTALDRVRETLAGAKLLSSDHRFREALGTVRKPPIAEASDLKGPSGTVVGKATFADSDVRLTLGKPHASEFAAFFKAELPALMERFFVLQANK